jgi:DNA invertase Pin-like site-specific DNA recombinase
METANTCGARTRNGDPCRRAPIANHRRCRNHGGLTSGVAGFRSLTEHIDTTIPAGRMLMQMLGAFAEFERAMIRERTRSGLAAARAKGRAGGRQTKLTPDQRREAIAMVKSGTKSAADVARLFKVYRTTISRVLAAASVGA